MAQLNLFIETIYDIPSGYKVQKTTINIIESIASNWQKYQKTTTNVYFEKLTDAFSAKSNNQIIQ